jgi:hypothetical protein
MVQLAHHDSAWCGPLDGSADADGFFRETGFPLETHAQQGFGRWKLCTTNAQRMKTTNILYWTSTGLVAAMTAMAGLMYFADPSLATAFTHLGFPDYFRIELGIAKLIAAVLLLLPMVPMRMKEWVYAGLAITFTSAFVAHTVVDGPATGIAPLISLALLVVSYLYAHKRQAAAARAHRSVLA